MYEQIGCNDKLSCKFSHIFYCDFEFVQIYLGTSPNECEIR